MVVDDLADLEDKLRELIENQNLIEFYGQKPGHAVKNIIALR